MQNVKNYSDENPNRTLVDFLQTISLETDIDGYDEEQESVSLATVHRVKGLEFKVIFVVGLEERFFPIVRANDDENDIEEERRLMYVAITRAKDDLHLVNARRRTLFGKEQINPTSRFLSEISKDLLDINTNE